MIIWIRVGERLGQLCPGMLPKIDEIVSFLHEIQLSPLILTTTNLHPSLTPGSFPRVIFYISINSYQTYVQKSLKACLLDEFNVFPNGLSSYFTFNSTPMSARNSPTLVAWLSCVNRSISVQSWCLISLKAKCSRVRFLKLRYDHATLLFANLQGSSSQSKTEN